MLSLNYTETEINEQIFDGRGLTAFLVYSGLQYHGVASGCSQAGTSPEGLPIAVQIVGQAWREDIVLAVAKVIEADLGGWKRPPI